MSEYLPPSEASRSTTLSVEWHNCAWSPVIVRRRLRNGRRTRRHRLSSLIPQSPYRTGFSRQPLTQNMNPTLHHRSVRRPAGFTLIELLTVIAIIAILAAMLLPVVSRVMVSAKVNQAKSEEAALITAIESYESAYGRFPVSPAAQAQASSVNNDFTYGGYFPGNGASFGMTNNNEVIAILMDMTSYPNGAATINANHVKNPKQTIFLNAKLSGSDPAASGKPLPGVDITGVYRDPWGNPYLITMDLNYDGVSSDLFYCQQAVSQTAVGSATGYNGLYNPTANPNTDNFVFRGKVMVWSAGPDGKFANTANAINGVNKDNVVSWK